MKKTIFLAITTIILLMVGFYSCKKDNIIEVTDITLNHSNVSMKVGEILTLTANVKPANATNKEIMWKSSANNEVSVEDGVITALKEGEATITATAGQKSVECKVTVTAVEVKVTDITITPATTVSIVVGETTTLTATVSPANATNNGVIWSSDNTNIATVNSETGVVTGVSAGTATIRVTAADGSGVTASKSVTVTAPASIGDGTAGNPYIITTPAQLDAIRDNLSAHYKLGKNIDLTAYLAPGGAGYAKWGTEGWKPIGIDYDAAFTGSLDGAGYKIAGIWINRQSVEGTLRDPSLTECIGLFGVIKNTTVKNLGVEIANDKGGIKGDAYVGGVAGVLGNGIMTNCYVSGAVSAGGDVGGVVGFVEVTSIKVASITNCYSTGTVSGGGWVGGVVGAIYVGMVDTVSGYDELAGYSIITNCYSSSTVKGYNWVGGVVGLAGCNVTNCYSTGTVSGNERVGGVVGSVASLNNITNCYYTGTVSGYQWVGGVAGWIHRGNITNCYSTGTVSGIIYIGGIAGENDGSFGGGSSIINCYTVGTVSGDSWAGGVAGRVYQGTIKNCYTAATVSGGGGVAGYILGDMTNCVALNPSVTGSYDCVRVSEGEYINNCWARSDMEVKIDGVNKILDKGSDKVDGADCDAIPAASWWTTAAPNGPGWSATDWIFTDGQLPKLR